MEIRVQHEDFDAGLEINRLRRSRPDIGAVAAFVGQVRDVADSSPVLGMTLEHYPGMTERCLRQIVEHAQSRWRFFDAVVIHRIGALKPQDQIVLVLVAGAHRGEAFAACEFIMDYLKTRAPFWKKEATPQGARWVETRQSDEQALERW